MDSFWELADDNAFYQQLTRQILMLTDEEDDDTHTYSVKRKPVGYGCVGSRPEASNYNYTWSGSGRCSVPSWMERLWANAGVGTGVFIPTATATATASGVTAGRKSGRRRYNHKPRRNIDDTDRGRMYSAVGQKIHG